MNNLHETIKESGKKVPRQTLELAEYLFAHLAYQPHIIRVVASGNIELEYHKDRYEFIVEIESNFHIWLIEHMEEGYSDCIRREIIERENMHELINIIKLVMGSPIKEAVLFTGAFNPPTIAHYHMAESALENGYDYVIYALSNQIFLEKKQNKTGGYAYSEQQRLDMIIEMTWDNPKILIYGIEEGYTYQVLKATQREFNIPSLSFAMGSDKLQEIQSWGFNKWLLSEFSFYVMVRDGEMKSAKKKSKKIFSSYKIVPPNPKYNGISATMVRNRINAGEDYEQLVHPAVYQYLSKIKKEVGA